jgi:argininosuccinate synthase
MSEAALPAGNEPILLAFSGGLDTSFLVPWLRATYSRPIITVTVDTGGIDAQAAKVLDQRARALGAQDHVLVEAKQAYFDQVIKYLIMGNVKRGQMYPLCVGADDRGVRAQARHQSRRARLHGRGQRSGAL